MEIIRFIAHVIDHRSSMLELSDVETPVNSLFPHDFFLQYIRHAREHKMRRRACFKNEDGRVYRAFQRILRDPQELVAASKEIAGHLYQAMSEGPFSRLIHPGDVMIALVAEEGARWLAILKIDPSDAVIRRLVMTAAGPQVIFEKRGNRIPTVEEDTVQKIAVLYDQTQEAPEPHDLVLLDNNIKETKVARFFWDAFLGSRLNRDGREVAQLFAKRVKRVVSQQPLSPDEQRRIVNSQEALLRRGRPLSIRSLARETVQASGRSGEEAVKLEDELVRDVTSYGPPDERIGENEIVPVDADAATELSRTRTYLLDGGIRVTGPTDEMEKRLKIVRSPGGAITLTLKTDSLEIV
jgi:hypothetical protein